jgi:hypothetical protein
MGAVVMRCDFILCLAVRTVRQGNRYDDTSSAEVVAQAFENSRRQAAVRLADGAEREE